MTEAEFERLPWLLGANQVTAATGWVRRTLDKYAEARVLRGVRPKGLTEKRYQKRQVAQLAGIALSPGEAAWSELPLLLEEKTVRAWTGYSERTLAKIVKAGGVRLVVLPGSLARYRKQEIGEWLGF